jgi:hypothetical protein
LRSQGANVTGITPIETADKVSCPIKKSGVKWLVTAHFEAKSLLTSLYKREKNNVIVDDLLVFQLSAIVKYQFLMRQRMSGKREPALK